MNSSRPYLIRALYEWIVDIDQQMRRAVVIDDPFVQRPDQVGTA